MTPEVTPETVIVVVAIDAVITPVRPNLATALSPVPSQMLVNRIAYVRGPEISA
jgi:hypothetical protein